MNLTNIKVKYICDDNSDHWGMNWCGYKVIDPKDLTDDYPVLVAATNNKYMKKQLVDQNETRIYDCDFLFKTRLPPVVESFRTDDSVCRSTDKNQCTA